MNTPPPVKLSSRVLSDGSRTDPFVRTDAVVGPPQTLDRADPMAPLRRYSDDRANTAGVPLDGRPRRGSGSAWPAMRMLMAQEDTTDRNLAPLGDAMKDARAPLPRGTRIDARYVVTRLIGRGGSSDVYEVYDRELDDRAALKLLRTDGIPATVGDRFRREMRICRRLLHENIVRTFEFGVWGDRLYYTMEILAGEDLAGVLLRRRDALTIRTVVRLMMQACDGLEEAHRIGVVHRDIKPHNLFLTTQGMLKLMDFGVAQGLQDLSTPLTAADHVIGTPAYMAPERLRKRATVFKQSDVYSLGASMYHLLSGRPPFQGEDLRTLFAAIVMKDAPPLTDHNANVPPPVAAVVHRAMNRELDGRYATCAEFRDALGDTIA